MLPFAHIIDRGNRVSQGNSRTKGKKPSPVGVALHLAAVCVLALSLAGCDGDSFEASLASVRAAQADGRYEDSLETLRRLLEEDPQHPEASYRYALALAQLGRGGVAVWPLRRLAATPEYAVEAGMLLGRVLLESENGEEAIAALDAVLARVPDHVDALALRAQAHVRAHREEEALADIDRILALDPDNRDLEVTRAAALIGIDQLDEAERALEAAQARLGALEDPPLALRARLCAARATFARERGDLEAAAQHFEACLEEFPSDGLVIAEAVEFFDAGGDADRSLEILRSALAENPGHLDMRIAIATRLRAAGEVEEAEALLLEATEQQPSIRSWSALGDHYAALEEYSRARSAFGQAMQSVLDPPPVLVFGYADTLIQEGDLEAAELVAQRLDPPFSDLLRGRILLERGDVDAALGALDAGNRLWPNNPTARNLTGQAAERVGDFDRAIAEYRESLRADAAYTDAGLRLGRLLAAEGQAAAALEPLMMYARSHSGDPEGYALLFRMAAVAGRADLREFALQQLAALPGQRAAAFAEAAALMREQAGPAAAVAGIEASGLDLTDPENAEALRALVGNLIALDDAEAGLARADAALARYEPVADFHEVRAAALLAAGRPTQAARASLARALEIAPEHAPSLAALAGLERDAGRPLRAVALYDRAAGADPDDPELAYAALDLLAATERRDEVEARLEQLLERHPYHAASASRLARALLARGADLERALELARRAMRFGGGADALGTLGWARLERGAIDPAIQALNAALELNPDAASTRYQLGRALAARGDDEAARAAFRAALQTEHFAERELAEAELAQLEARTSEGR